MIKIEVVENDRMSCIIDYPVNYTRHSVVVTMCIHSDFRVRIVSTGCDCTILQDSALVCYLEVHVPKTAGTVQTSI